jgi:hypothetical protein
LLVREEEEEEGHFRDLQGVLPELFGEEAALGSAPVPVLNFVGHMEGGPFVGRKEGGPTGLLQYTQTTSSLPSFFSSSMIFN